MTLELLTVLAIFYQEIFSSSELSKNGCREILHYHIKNKTQFRDVHI